MSLQRRYAHILIAIAVFYAASVDAGDDAVELSIMKTRNVTPVHVKPRKYSTVTARIYPGAVLKVVASGSSRGCRAGWVERKGGGFICASHLKKTDADKPHPAPSDRSDILTGTATYEILRGGSRLYKRAGHIDRHVVYKRLIRGSFLRGVERVTRYGTDYLRTRARWWASAKNLIKLPSPIRRLGVDVVDGATPWGIIISAQTKIYEKPDGAVSGELARWTVLKGDKLSYDQGEWVALPIGGYIRNEDVALVRVPPSKEVLGIDEKWIAVDLKEQLLHTYEGKRLVRVIPCSTGIRGNTNRGWYHIQWKRRLQTLRLRGGRIRVEDVQHVMYYDQRNSIAIHSAYWNFDFGQRKSHGCVNLPMEDASLLYEWSLPHSRPEDSENYHTHHTPGTKVFVF